jgi:DNA polymerase III subunit epsilon
VAVTKKSSSPLIACVPELVVGFDTETTGLEITTQRAISYGFSVFQYGVPVWQRQFFVIPDVEIAPAAQRVHGLSLQDLEDKRHNHVVTSVGEGALLAGNLIRTFHEWGAIFVGLNVVKFDFAMLFETLKSVHGEHVLSRFKFDELHILDVRDHDLVLEPQRDKRPRRNLDSLCEHYGVIPGGHDALSDARATVEVFLRQIEVNQSKANMPASFTFPMPHDIQTKFEKIYSELVRDTVETHGRLAQSGSALA